VNDTVHAAIREQIADGALDEATREHLATCDDCRAFQRRLTMILQAAGEPEALDPVSADEQVDELFAAVVGASRARWWQRNLIGIGAAAAAVVVLVAGAFVIGRGSDPAKQAAPLAASWTTGETRFVFEATTRVPLPAVEISDDLAPASLRRLPQCDDATAPTDSVPTSIDVAALADSLFDDQPCTVLAAIDNEIGAKSSATLTTLRRQLVTAEAQLQALQPALSSPDVITSQSAKAATAQLEALKQQLTTQITDLLDAHDQSVKGLAPLAEAASAGQPTSGFEPVARDAMTALVAAIDRADTSTVPVAMVWRTLATGTWTAESVTVAGSTDTPTGDVLAFDAAAGDVLALTSALFTDPDTIPAILRTAPSADGNVVNWKVPSDLVTIPGVASLEATATLDGGRLDTLVLTGERADGTTISITITVGR
jgi:hypothetical protein